MWNQIKSQNHYNLTTKITESAKHISINCDLRRQIITADNTIQSVQIKRRDEPDRDRLERAGPGLGRTGPSRASGTGRERGRDVSGREAGTGRYGPDRDGPERAGLSRPKLGRADPGRPKAGRA